MTQTTPHPAGDSAAMRDKLAWSLVIAACGLAVALQCLAWLI